jgi:thiamine transport system substrate-binding protein
MKHARPRWRTATRSASTTAALLLAVSACSVAGGGGEEETTTGSAADGSTVADRDVTLLVHDSWYMPKKVLKAFEQETGYRVEVQTNGDAGALTNKLVLTQDNPLGDAVFGIDNTFASRAVDQGVLAPYTPADLPASVADYALDGEAGEQLTPVDWGDVCVNVDEEWFAERDQAPPETLDDLADPAYRDLFVTPAASTSSPGFAFLLATIGEYGEDGWEDYWARLMDNGARVAKDWTEAYTVDFTAGGGNGDRPVVLSYSSSPPFTIPEGEDRPTTSALLDTCFRQVEYAGVLAGADNPEGAQALVDFLVERAFQKALPDNMYVYPVDDTTPLPPLWEKWAEPATDPIEVDPAEITAQRDDWIRTWSDVTAG